MSRHRESQPGRARRVQFPDAQVRGIRNAIVREWEHRDDPPPYRGLDPASEPVVGTTNLYGEEIPLPRFTGLPPTRATRGDLEQLSLSPASQPA